MPQISGGCVYESSSSWVTLACLSYPTSPDEDGCGVTSGGVAYAAWIRKGMTVAAWFLITLPRMVCYVKFTHYYFWHFPLSDCDWPLVTESMDNETEGVGG